MKTAVILGIVLIVLGLAGLIYGGLNYTKKETVVDLGSVELRVDEKKQISIPPILGGIALAAGVILVFKGRRAISRGRAA
jgi:hypothetical protein